MCNSCASLAGLVLCFIACFILLVIAPLPVVMFLMQVEQSTSKVVVNPTSSTSSGSSDETVQPLTSSVDPPTASATQKDRQRSVAATTTSSYSHSKLLQPTVVLRHWNGVSSTSPASGRSAKVKDAKIDGVSGQINVEDVTVRYENLYSPYMVQNILVIKHLGYKRFFYFSVKTRFLTFFFTFFPTFFI